MRRAVSRLGLDALAQSPADVALFDTFARLRDRGFMPPAPLALPEGSPDQVARALSRRTPEELRALAASFVALPDGAAKTAKTVAEVLIAAKDPRAATLCGHIAAQASPSSEDAVWAALASLRLELEAGASPDALTARVNALPPLAQAEALARLVCATLTGSAVRGARWLVPVEGGRFVAQLALATERRPALASELGEPASRLLALLPTLAAAGHTLAHAELLLAAHRFDEADELHASLHPDERAQLAEARAELFEGASLSQPPLCAAPLPESDLEQHLSALGQPEEAARTFVTGALRERLGDRAGAARLWAELAVSHLIRWPATPLSSEALAAATGAVRLAGELPEELRSALKDALSAAFVPDELTLASSPDQRQVAGLSLRLAASPLAAARLFAALPRPAAPLNPTSGPSEADPHHPASRLAAASDLLAEGRLEPAANILAALLRKAEPDTPERLFGVVASALESDPPPEDLLAAAQRALDDAPRATRLIAALRRSATAAFALHEELLGLAKDPSRPDPLRLAALECWLNIWAETTTPPNPDLLATLREVEPAMLTAAATAIGSAQRASDPVSALRSFLDARFASPSAWSDALLELMLGAR